MDTLAIIKRIELRLAEMGMSKADFYKESGISSASYSQWNTGLYKPSEKKLKNAAECLGVPFEYLRDGKISSDAPVSENAAADILNEVDLAFYGDYKEPDEDDKETVRVEYVAENIPDSPEGVILESVLEGIAEYYSLQLSQNVRRGQAVSVQKCQSVGGVRPLGYITDENKRYAVDPKTAPTVKLIFELYSKGDTVTEIIRHLNDEGLTTAKGKPFTKNSLYSVLNNEKYTGVYIHNGTRIDGGMPQIVEPELFQRVQELMKVNRRAPSHKWSRADYILTDKLFCGKCGSPMVGECGTGKSGMTYNYYICSKRKRFRACDKKAVRQDWIEEIVLREIKAILENDELLKYIAANTYRYYMLIPLSPQMFSVGHPKCQHSFFRRNRRCIDHRQSPQ